MRIAIVEDENEDIKHLAALLESWSQDRQLSIDYDCYKNGESFLDQYEKNKYTLVFLDIYLTGITGIEVAHFIRKSDMDCLLVFLTTSREHTWDSFKVHPFDYLIKPCSQESLDYVLSEATKTLNDINHSLELTISRSKVSILYNELPFLVADGHYIRTCTVNQGEIRCYISSFTNLWEILQQDPRFLLCNRGIILNMDFVEKLNQDCFVMKNGEVFPIRQRNRSEVIQTFLAYQYNQAKLFGERFHR